MLTFKRIITACVFFAIFFCTIYLAICMAGGAFSAVMVGFNNPAEYVSEDGEQAGAMFVTNNIIYILVSSLVLSLVSASWLSFSGVLPWCRRKTPDTL